MLTPLAGPLAGAPFKYFADWTDRIAKGELPHSQPPRPQGIERNIVVTTWEWGDPKNYLHDLIASDRRHPTVNAYGPLFGSPEYGTDVTPDPRSPDPYRHALQGSGTRRRTRQRRSAPDMPRSPSRWRRRPTGATRRSGTARPTTTTACSTERGRVWFAARCAALKPRLLPARAPTIPPPSCSHWSTRTARSRCSIRRP